MERHKIGFVRRFLGWVKNIFTKTKTGDVERGEDIHPFMKFMTSFQNLMKFKQGRRRRKLKARSELPITAAVHLHAARLQRDRKGKL
jgi:hypothetical protein